MVCRPFEGTLLQKRPFRRSKKRWIRLCRGTITITNKKSDGALVEDKQWKKCKGEVYAHLDSANVVEGRHTQAVKLRLQNGSVFKFRVPRESGPTYRPVWILAFEDHIAYANWCVGTVDPNKYVECEVLEKISRECQAKIDMLQKSIDTLILTIKNTPPTALNSDVTHKLLDVSTMSEKTIRSVKEYHDSVRQENLKRDDQLFFEMKRAEEAEISLEIITEKFNILLINQEKRSCVSSEYFTPDGSLRSFRDMYHCDDELEPDELGLMFPKVQNNQLSGNNRLKPRRASYGPLSVAGSIWEDSLSNRSSGSHSDMFLDCISIDTRSFVVSNAAISKIENENSTTTTDGMSYKTATSSFKDIKQTP